MWWFGEGGGGGGVGKEVEHDGGFVFASDDGRLSGAAAPAETLTNAAEKRVHGDTSYGLR